MFRPHQSVSLSVFHSVLDTNQFVRFSWYSVNEFYKRNCIKQARKRFRKGDSMPAVLYWMKSINFYLRFPYFLMDLCELGTENLHITPFCKYQINQNRGSGSHIIVQGVDKKWKICSQFLNFDSDLNTIRYRTWS